MHPTAWVGKTRLRELSISLHAACTVGEGSHLQRDERNMCSEQLSNAASIPLSVTFPSLFFENVSHFENSRFLVTCWTVSPPMVLEYKTPAPVIDSKLGLLSECY